MSYSDEVELVTSRAKIKHLKIENERLTKEMDKLRALLVLANEKKLDNRRPQHPESCQC